MMLPYIVEGEVIQVLETTGISPHILYECEVNMPDNTKIIVSNCIQASFMGGGVENYTIHRLRARNDDNQFENDGTPVEYNASIGDRVYIAFVNGSLLYPLIIGYAQHLNQSQEDVVNAETGVAAVKQILGFRQVIDEDGNIYFVRKGSPKNIKLYKQSILPSLGTSSITSDKPTKILGKSNPAIEENEDTEIITMDFYKGGIFRVRDAMGGLFELDHNKNRVYISNNDLKSTEDPESGPASGGNQMASNSTDAEYVMLDRDKQLVLINARKILQLYSFDARKDVTEGNHSHKIKGSDTVTVTGDSNYSANALTFSIKKNIAISSTGGDIEIKGTAGSLKITKAGQIALGSSKAEIITILAETLKAFVDNASTLVSTSTGPGVLNPALSQQIAKAQGLLESIKA